MNIYEVFLKKPGKEEFRHAGSMQAPDDEMARLLARDAYSRRGEGAELWLVDRSNLIVADPELLEATADVAHRANDGTAVAARRKRMRADA